MSAAAIIIALAIIIAIAAIPTIVCMALAMPPRRPDPAAGRTSALIGLRGWHGCRIDAAGCAVWVDPVARPTAAEALMAAHAHVGAAGTAP